MEKGDGKGKGEEREEKGGDGKGRGESKEREQREVKMMLHVCHLNLCPPVDLSMQFTYWYSKSTRVHRLSERVGLWILIPYCLKDRSQSTL